MILQVKGQHACASCPRYTLRRHSTLRCDGKSSACASLTLSQLPGSYFASRADDVKVIVELQIGLKQAESTLAAASSLLSKLAGEKASWQQQADLLTQALPTLPASSVIAAACVVYAAEVPEDKRLSLMRSWRSVVGKDSRETFSLPQFLCKGGELTEWAALGLPTDQVLLLLDAIHCIPYTYTGDI